MMMSLVRFRSWSTSQQATVGGIAVFVLLLGLHYVSWYYDSVLSAMAGDRSDPDVAARACARAAGHPAAARFWGIMRRYGGEHVEGGGSLMTLERLNLDAVLDRARPLLLTAEGLRAVDDAKRRSDGGDRIPSTVHQTYTHRLTPDVYPTAYKLPQAWEALTRGAAGGEYRFWDDEKADAFLDRHFQPEVSAALRALVPGAFKADLFRYCVLYVEGGVYADIDVRPLVPSLSELLRPGIRLITPKQDGLCQCGVWQGLLAAAPGHPALLLAVLLIVAQAEARLQPDSLALTFCPGPVPLGWDKDTHLYLTGPDLLGRVISTWLQGESCGRLTPGVVSPDDISQGASEGTRLQAKSGMRPFGTTHILRQKGRVITTGVGADGAVADTPVLPDMGKHGHCPRYRWLWHTRRAYVDTGRFLGWDVRSVFDAVGCTIGSILKAFGL